MWLAWAIVNWVIGAVSVTARLQDTPEKQKYTWSLVPEVSAAYTESETDTFREYQNKLRIAIQDLESELKLNKSVSVSNLQNIKSLVQAWYERLPDFGEAGTTNDSIKRATDLAIDLAIKNPTSSSQVGNAISTVATFISSSKIESVQGGISATPNQGNAPLIVSFQATGIKDPSGATPDNMSYIWWMRENGWVRRELWRGKSLIYTFSQEWSYTVFLDVISGSRNSKKRVDVLPLSASTTIDVKSRLGEVVLLINGVNASNLDTLKVNPAIGKMGIILDATASRATGGNIIETTWDFGNNNTITYDGWPIVERQIYANEWTYTVKLTLKSNNGQSFSKNIRLIVRNPSAVIQWEKTTGNIGEDMYFSSLSYFTNSTNVEYSWQIQDDNNKKIINNLGGSSLRHKFDKVGSYIVTLTARSPNGEIDTDSRQVTIESRPPTVNLASPVAASSESPNVLTFDASKSYDPDTMGRSGLTYTWRIDGAKVDLDNQSHDGAKWTYVFDSIGTHSVSLTIANIYGKVTTVERSFEVKSLLAANLLITPRVAPIGTIVNFIAQSENADFYEWNMWDGSPVQTGNKKIIQHIYKKTGIYDVTLTVSSARSPETNQIRRRVYVTDTNSPFAMIQTSNGSNTAYYDESACGWSGAMIVNRSESTTIDGSKSINIDGSSSDLTYTWSYFGKVKTTPSLSEKFNEIGCYPIKLTVRSNKNGATHTSTEYISIKNLPPDLTSISTSIDTSKKDSQKVLVRVSANGASDPDGVITSYIWYYTTESDKEPQNIQVTQKPEITFVLPNITEKYYFGVILEDNDGAKTNSMDEGSEQIPLILDNQNGNIYMPLITLSMPKNAILVWESAFLSAEAKTIVGTNITKNAEYAWDFDGDWRFDERSNNPSVNHVFKNSGTYQVKVKVTYNGVSNTKYATVYVKNPLKASAIGYTLPDGGLYFMNTSEGLYDRSLWTIDGEQTESPYTLTISKTQLEKLTWETIGTLRISNWEIDSSTFVLSKSGAMSINSGTGISYQSSPQAIDNTVHIKWQSDRLILSFFGNNNANTYKVDTDTRIDSDLDGVTDNDADNKNHSSYTEGGAYVISDFTDTRVRERMVRVTLMSGNTVLWTQDIKIVFDFIPEGQGSGDDVFLSMSGAMSSFERTKLEELATMIRATDSTDRIILMQEYNTMIENWDDSFSKAKSLVDIQEIINTTSMSEDKKIAMSAIVDNLLIGDAISTDEVTLATKLIEDLIPEASQNRAIILEKLAAISSHPGDIEENKTLGKEILELVKNDTTIEDKYKIHIKNQLLIIINGWQASVPVEEVEETSSSWGSIIGFIKGVVWVFLYIIWGILFVLLLGYIFYLMGRKNDDIWFQDFLIDSVFHAKKGGENVTTNTTIVNPIVSDNSSVIIKPTPVAQATVDPLASYTPIVVQEKPLEVAVEPTHDPLSGTESASIPSWLQVQKSDTPSETIEVAVEESVTPAVENVSIESNNSTISSDSIPSWLQAPSVEASSELTTSDTSTQDISPVVEESTVPSWLQAASTESDLLKVDNTSTSSEVPTIEAPVSDITEAPLTGDTSTSEPTSDALPDWLVDSLKSWESTEESWTKSDTESKVKEKKKKAPKKEKKEDSWATPSSPSDIPDWLK